MSYQIFPNIIFIFSVLGILLIILRHLPNAVEDDPSKLASVPVQEKLIKKGLPAVAFSQASSVTKLWFKRFWNFMLEAKDLKPTAITGYNLKKIFGNRHLGAQKTQTHPSTTQDIKDEKFFLEAIKKEPKNFTHYDSLGKYYLEKNSFTDSRDIYEYLTNHQPTNGDYSARLAYSCYQLKQYDQAAIYYERSLALDSAQPNRYYNLGLSWEALGQPSQAEHAILSAIALEPKNSKYYISLSNIYSKMGEQVKAKTILEQARHFDPKNETLKEKISKLGK